MTRKKKPVRVRTTYDVTLEHATARLQKAVQERTDCLTKLEVLSRQIPWLENLVHALTPQPDPYAPTTYAVPPSAAPEPVPEEYLAKFMPKPGRLTTTQRPGAEASGNASDPDEFLRDEPLS